MFKLLKWDFLNFIKKYYWLYVSCGVIFIITLVLLHNTQFIFNEIFAAYSFLFYFYTIILSFVLIINWLRKNTIQLELSLPVKPWKILFSKFILAISINISGLLFSQILWKSIGKFGLSKITLFNDFTGFMLYMIGMMILLVIFMFSYLSVKSFSFIRKMSGIMTLLLSAVICMTLFLIVWIFFAGIGVWDVNNIGHGNFHILINEKRKWLTLACSIIGLILFFYVSFFVCSLLLRNKIED